MKNFLYVFVLIFLTSCAGYHTAPKFYDRYKESKKVEAYQLPKFKEPVMDSLSPYTRNLLLDVTDLRYIKINQPDLNQNELLKIEIRGLFRRRFKDLQRVITNDSLKIVSMKVKDNIATDFLAYFNYGPENAILYIAGDMDPRAVREFFETGEHIEMMDAMVPENFEPIDANLKVIEEKNKN
ncbi:MAG: hypothetical protein HKO81_09505 [Flavobacteriaceae bacterium]|nr:hypothetical protein [Bacteroidia bacterium]NNL16859.1 hypothetical protein [Flavobacteriaceae bacterium]